MLNLAIINKNFQCQVELLVVGDENNAATSKTTSSLTLLRLE